MSWIIYKHTNIKTGKAYIGLTCRSLVIRWGEHKRKASSCKYINNHFHNALRKYGTNCWEHEILVGSITSLDEAYMHEKFYVDKFNTFTNGYNSTVGGYNIPTIKVKDHRVKYTKIYLWKHCSGVKKILSIVEMKVQYSTNSSAMSAVIRREKLSHHGWFLAEYFDNDVTKAFILDKFKTLNQGNAVKATPTKGSDNGYIQSERNT